MQDYERYMRENSLMQLQIKERDVEIVAAETFAKENEELTLLIGQLDLESKFQFNQITKIGIKVHKNESAEDRILFAGLDSMS
jgi:hypothetical protein